MNIELTNLGSCKRNLTVEIPADVAQQEFDKISQKYVKLAMVPGFRPGKAPLSIIKRRFYREIKAEVIQESVDKYFKEAVDNKNLKPVSEPQFDKIEFEPGSPLTFQVTFEILPEINISDYKGLEISLKKKPEVTDERIEEVIARRREQAATYVPIKDRAVRRGDLVTMNVFAKVEGQEENELVEKDISYEIGDEGFHPVFAEKLEGLNAGDETSFTIDYEPSHPDSRLAGKKVAYRVQIVEAKEKILPDVNDDFARDLGEFENLQQLKESIRKSLQEMIDKTYREEATEQLLKRLREKYTFDVPEALVNQQLKGIVKNVAYRLHAQGIDTKSANIDWEKVVQENQQKAITDVQNLLIVDDIAKKEHIDASDEEVDRELEGIAKASGVSVEALRAGYQKEGGLKGLKEDLRFKKALDFIYQHAKIITGE